MAESSPERVGTMKAEEKPTGFAVHERLLIVNERIMIATDNFRCLGYRDGDGVWRYDKDDRQIKNVIGWHRFLD
jgi:hypothetical protein